MIKNTKYSIGSLFLIAVIIVFSFNGFGQTYIFTSGTSWEVPAGVNAVTVECWGAGGGGGGVAGTSGAGGGGGGGAYAKTIISVTPGISINYSIGTGGSATQDGGDTWFKSQTDVLAKGGKGGTTSGGAGGTAASSVGTVKFSGGNGGERDSDPGGGGGGAAGQGSNGENGGNGAGATPGAGGTGYYPEGDEGYGGNGGSVSANGDPGKNYGGGGGGSGYWSTYAGGTGATGVIVITVLTCPPPINLSATKLSDTSYELIWDQGGTESLWNIVVGQTGFDPNNPAEYFTSQNGLTGTSFTVNGLDPDIGYEFYVMADCGGGDFSVWAGPFMFNVQCLIFTYTTKNIQAYHHSDPAEWYPNSCNGEISVTVPLGHEISSVDTEYDMITAPPGGPPAHRIDHQRSVMRCMKNSVMLAEEPSVSVGVGADIGTYSYNRTGLTFANGLWGDVDFQLHAGATNAYDCHDCCNSFVYVDNNTWKLNICFEFVCYPPHTLIATATGPTTYVLTWQTHPNSTSTQWNVVVGPQGFDPNNPAEYITSNMGIATTSWTVTLMDEENEFYVQSDCELEGISVWEGPKGINQPPELDFTVIDNTVCDAVDCEYAGPTIMINEVMISPSSGDGSMVGQMREGEWIELYNPDECQWADVSCFYLGNSTPDGGQTYPGGYVIPEGAMVPPLGFVIVRGRNVSPVPAGLLYDPVSNPDGKVIEYVIDDNNRYCLGGGSRLWFRNDGGWFAFYDNNGVPQDAISWCESVENGSEGIPPCIPTPGGACNFGGVLPSYIDIPDDRKNYITALNPQDNQDQSFRRIPDGGIWQNTSAAPTYAQCNDICTEEQLITCDGEATVIISGGTPPFQIFWDDKREQTTEKAVILCAGDYCVTVIDANLHEVYDCIYVDEDCGCDIIPDPTNPQNQEICQGDAIPALSVDDPGAGYHINWYSQQTGGTLLVTNSTSYTTTVTSPGIHTFYAETVETATACRSNRIPVTLTIIEMPVLIVVSVYCDDDLTTYTVEFTNTVGNIGTTAGTIDGSSIIEIPIDTNITITSDNNGCTADVFVPFPDCECGSIPEPVNPQNQEICEGDAVPALSVDDPGAGYQINWYDESTGGTALIEGSNSYTPDDTEAGIYTYYAETEEIETECKSSRIPVSLTIYPLPDATINPAGPFCVYDTAVTLSAVTSGGTWSGQSVNEVTGVFNPSDAGVGNHNITYEVVDGICSDSDEIIIQVIDQVEIFINPVDPFCYVEGLMINLTATPEGGTWLGQGVSNQGILNVTGAGVGIREITYTISGDCGDTDTIWVTIYPSNIDATMIVTNPSCYGSDDAYINLTVTGGTSPYTFLLEDREFSNMEDISGLSAGQYNITIIDVNGCTAVVTALIAEGIENCIKIPNAFTPNGDGINDTWIIQNINAFPDHYIQVFNRWGQEVYRGQYGDAPWDGTYNGKALPTAPYLYIVNLNVAEAKNDVYIGIVTIVY